MVIYGKLPVSIKNYELGDIEFGKWNSVDKKIVGATVYDASTQLNAYCINPSATSGVDAVNIIAEKKANETLDSVKPMNFAIVLNDTDAANVQANTLVIDFRSAYKGIEKALSGDFDWFDKIKIGSWLK